MSDPPYDPTSVLLGNGGFASCKESSNCCGSIQYADLFCKHTYGGQYGYSNVFATPAINDPIRPVPTCKTGNVYQCRANVTQECDRGTDAYNRKGPFGTVLLEEKLTAGTLPKQGNTYMTYSNTPAYWAALDGYCRAKYGKTAVRAFGDRNNPYGRCVRVDWTKSQYYPDSNLQQYAITQWRGSMPPLQVPVTRPDVIIPTAPSEDIEKCCNPKDPDPYASFACSPQTCFGKKACDNTQIVQSICSDKDNVATDSKCADTCVRLNDTGSSSWCNNPIKAYCQGKNLETETCRNYCSAANLDNNPDLAAFCENQYVNYCAKKNDPSVDVKRQEKLCACINSPLPNAACVDAACTNGISVLAKRQRDTFKAGCPDICLQNFVVDGKVVVDIDHLKWEQYCPGQPIPGSNPDNPYYPPDVITKETISKYATYIGVPVIIVLVIIALVFLLLKG
jgi:hypothetical protein